MQAIDLHKKLQKITKQNEYGAYIPVADIARLCSVTPDIVVKEINVLHDLCFLEYPKSSTEKVRLTITGKLANLEDYCRTSNDFDIVIKETWKESEGEKENDHRLFSSPYFLI